jgi:membrane peptidoglycan carboxypeptidase
MLKRVVEYGTGKEARISGLPIAGKTGTAQQLVNGQYSKQDYTASFVGYFPADAPKVAMIVMLHKPKSSIYGGSTSAPIFKKIAQKWITASRIPVSDIEHTNAGARQRVQDSAIVPDMRGLSIEYAQDMLHEIGLRIRGAEHGIIVQQSIPMGTWMEKGKTITVKTQDGISSGNASKTFMVKDTHGIVQPKSGTPTILRPMPDVRGMSIRRALSVLHASGYTARLSGKGKVISQIRSTANPKECILQAK